MTDPAEVWLPIKEAATDYGLDYFQLHKWYKRGHVRGRKVHGRIEIERASLENQLLPSSWVWLSECSQQYEISGAALFDLVQKGQVHARKSGGRWQVERASLEQVLAERAIPAGWLTAREAGQRLGVTGQEVLRRIRDGQLHARAHGQQLLVAEEEVQGLAIPPGWLTTRQLAEKAQVRHNTVYGWIAKGWLPARKVHGRWIVEDRLPERKRPEKQVPQGGPKTRRGRKRPATPADWKPVDENSYLTVQEAADRYGLTYSQLHKLIEYAHVRRIHEGRYVLVDIASLEDWLPPPGWAWLRDAAKEYGISYGRVRALIRQGQVRARKRGLRWQVEREGIARALARKQIPAGWITISEASSRLQVPSATVLKRIEAGLLPGRKHGWFWILDEAAVMAQVPPPGWLNVPEVTRRTQLAQATIIAWIQEGKIGGQKCGGRWFVDPTSIAALTVAPEEWIRVAEASARWGVPDSKVRYWIRQGRVPARKSGGIWFVAAGGPSAEAG